MAFKQLVFLLLVCIPGSVRGEEECKRPIIPHSNSTSSTPLLKDGEGIVVTCYDGYSNGHSQSSYTVCIDGVLKPPVPQCYANCYRPVVPHSDANSPTPVLHHGEFFTVTCDTGYSNGKTQSTISQCMNGYMTPPILNCYANCVPRIIPHSDHSTQQPDVLNGQTTTIKCCKNFSMGPETQSITLTCYDGELNDETVRCYENCQLIQIPINGNISKGSPFFHYEEVRFQCCAEYNLVGETEIVCFDGSWSGYPPVCIKEHQISWRKIVLGVFIFVTSVIVIVAVVKVAVKIHELRKASIPEDTAPNEDPSQPGTSSNTWPRQVLPEERQPPNRHKSRKAPNWEHFRIMDKMKSYGTGEGKRGGDMKDASKMEPSSKDWPRHVTPEERQSPNRSIQTSFTGTPSTNQNTSPAETAAPQVAVRPNPKWLGVGKGRFDDVLKKVAKKVVQDSEIDDLGSALGFHVEDRSRYIAMNHRYQNITNDGTLQMLRDWRKRQTESTECLALKRALEESDHVRLADDLFGRGNPTCPE